MKSYQSLLVVLAAVLWSTDALFREPLTRTIPAVVIVLMEHFFALVFVIPLIIRNWVQVKTLGKKEWWAVIAVGVGASALATIAFTASFSYVSPSVSILLLKLQPLFTFVLAYVWLKERMPKYFWWWAILALVGAYLISFPNLSPGDLSIYSGGPRGVMLALAAAILWGSATVFNRHLLNKVSFPVVTSLRFITALVFLGLLTFFTGQAQAVTLLTAHDVLLVLGIMVFSGFGAMYIYYKGLFHSTASLGALMELAFPIGAVILNWFFLDKALSVVQILGGIILLGAIAKLTLWPSRE